MAGVAGKGIANVKIGDKGRLEETPREQGCAGGMMRSRASLVSGVQGTGQLCGSFLQNTCPFLLGERRVDGAACPLEEGEAGGAPVAVWKQSAPCAGAQTPVVAHSPPHAGACPPVPVHVPRTGASLQHARGGTEEQHSRQQELSIAERRRATRPYRGRGKTAASVMPSCGPPLYFQTPRLRLGVFLVCSTGPGSSSPAEQQPVPWMGSPLPRSGSGTFGCSSSLRGHRALPWEQLSPASGCVPCKPVAMCGPREQILKNVAGCDNIYALAGLRAGCVRRHVFFPSPCPLPSQAGELPAALVTYGQRQKTRHRKKRCYFSCCGKRAEVSSIGSWSKRKEARPLLVAGSGLVTRGGKEYLHFPNSSFVSLSG
ncbi:uncharacterized protein LOC115349349 isoform X2 [Aquila chrysaetos chrysaetos]|uniref:uncharacterized protein LOC115349349 isoform X2 n=1 Tax=Aquila chrysaetos chrysaetos TaxID=223781 RepID=UPI001176BF0F|nr:uncharacterized protein LOC115349349 isoform X2 [Aquila chrysaetos chrysaetos]